MRGGPDGGDGGRGGDVVFAVDEGLRTLMDFKYQRKFMAENGEPGKKKNMHGKNGKDIVIHVPPGTVIRDFENRPRGGGYAYRDAYGVKGCGRRKR